ncbi:hypothetical protein BCR44DRAFT_1483652 [Catenaria anguillulae PL171]|uniref:NAD-dependent epimerase/dehydratase domain-containing protein n=1 Tax=Catenaria anguillulae PL171 TaxID=765915 RepID=A0A1Y2HWA0_9FUNG|nr:hypothetical protein BCR44DRAFT_1483652 [Catenaria anguillulae PL171]
MTPPPPPPSEPQPTPIHALVTGGAGFVGSHFVRHLLASHPSSKVTILDNLSTAGIHTIAPLIHVHGRDRVQFVLGSVTNETLVRKLVTDVRPSVIVHLVAPKVGPKGECDAGCQATLANGTQAVVAAAASALDPMPRIVVTSSSDVYGPIPSLVKPGTFAKFFEQDPVHLVTPVARAMANAEQIVASHARLMARPATAFILLPEPANTDPRRWTGAGVALDKHVVTDAVDWVHISDVCKALMRAVTVKIANDQVGRAYVINVGSGACGHRSQCTRADISTAENLLDYHPQFTGINRTDMQRMQQQAEEADPQTHSEYTPLLSSLSTSTWLLPRLLLRPVYAPLANNLTALAHHTAQHRSPAQHAMTLTIGPFQSGYRSMVENAVYSLMTWGKVRNLLLFAIDAASAAECLYLNMPCFNATSLATADFTNQQGLDPKYRDKIWSVISWVKPRLVRELLRLGYTVNLSDADIGFLRNVWLSYDEYMREVDADMSITSEISASFVANTGNYVVRPTPESLRFFDEYVAIGNDDPIFRNLTMSFCTSLDTCNEQRARGLLPIREYSPLFGRFNLCPHPIDVCKPDMLYVHPICIARRDDKVEALKRFGAWNMADADHVGYYCEEKSKVGGFECPGVPRAVANGYEVGLWCLGGVATMTNAGDN